MDVLIGGFQFSKAKSNELFLRRLVAQAVTFSALSYMPAVTCNQI